ncbi:MAG: hypothetical protein ACRDQ7_23215 [Haloechinothrix sp.]
MTSPGGGHEADSYSHQIDPFNGQPIPPGYGTGGYYQAPPYEEAGYQVPTYPGHQGASGYPGGPGQPPGKRSPAIPIAIGAFALLVLAGVAVILLFSTGRQDDSHAQAGAPLPTSEQAPAPPTTSAEPAPSEPAEPESVQDITVPAITSGWQGVLSYKENVAYDVPKDWTVENPGTLVGFEDESGPRAIMHGVSTYQDGACESVDGSYRSRVGFMTAGDADPRRSVPIAAAHWAEAAAELPEDSGKVEPTEAAPVKVAAGKISAWTSSAAVDMPGGGDCPAPKMRITAVAFTPEQGGDTAMFIMYSDVGVPDELPEDIAEKMVASLRPYEG